MKASKMELIEKTPIKIDRKLVSIPLPEKLILYALDSSHILLALKPINELEKKSLSKQDVKVTQVGNEYLIELPKKVYDFYHLDEADYTTSDIRNKPKNNRNTDMKKRKRERSFLHSQTIRYNIPHSQTLSISITATKLNRA